MSNQQQLTLASWCFEHPYLTAIIVVMIMMMFDSIVKTIFGRKTIHCNNCCITDDDPNNDDCK